MHTGAASAESNAIDAKLPLFSLVRRRLEVTLSHSL
jgi:hypothetical protein